MYDKNRFVVCVLVNGRIVRESPEGIVAIPLGTEYSIRLRNKNPRRAVAVVTIDGENVSSGGFVVSPNSFIDIERSADVQKRFLFVSACSEAAADFGKDGPNVPKGKIEVKFYFEKERYPQIFQLPRPAPKHPDTWYEVSNGWNNQPIRRRITDGGGGGTHQCNYMSKAGGQSHIQADNLLGMSLMDQSVGLSEQGVTVEGGYSSQQFYETHVDLESYPIATIVIQMVGDDKKARLTREVQKFAAEIQERERKLRDLDDLKRRVADMERELKGK